MNKIIPIVIVAAIILGVLFWKFGWDFINNSNQPKEVTLTYWGLSDDESVIKPVLDDYRLLHPNVRINYVKQSLTNYRSRVQTQLHQGQGPDIFWIHNSWLPMVAADLSTVPSSIISLNDFQKSFYPIAKSTLTSNGKIYGLPLEIDGLALYYNEDILKAASVNPPDTWVEFLDAAKKMTVPNQYGQIQTAGAAMGTVSNVNHWSEILGTLFLQQPAVTLSAPNNKLGGDVLRFYVDFVINPADKTWDVTLPSSTKMFTDGKLAFYFGTAREAADLKRANPSLHFKTAPVPKLPDGQRIAWGTFWAATVSNRSANQNEAWEFANYLSSPRAQQLWSLQKSQTAGFNIPYPRTEMAGLLADDPVLNTFLIQAPNYQSWYLNSDTGDAGINDDVTALYAKAVSSTLSGGNPQSALEGISKDLTQTISKYLNSQAPLVNQ